MDDIYSVLMGAAPTDSVKQAAIADALRKKKEMSLVAQMTGDRVIAPIGQQLGAEAENAVGSLQRTRQQDLDNTRQQQMVEQTGGYQQGQLSHMDDLLAEEKRWHNMEYMTNLAKIEEMIKKAGKPKSLTYADRNKLENSAKDLQDVNTTISDFKDEYTQKMGPGPQSKLSNTLASMGIGSQGMKDASDWWGSWNQIYTIPQRNRAFGATLTPHEKQAWAESEINPNMDGEQVRKRMNRILSILHNHATITDKTYRAQYGDDIMDAYGLPNTPMDLGKTPAVPAAAVPAKAALPKAGEVRGGWKYKGGDPGDKNSWEKVGG